MIGFGRGAVVVGTTAALLCACTDDPVEPPVPPEGPTTLNTFERATARADAIRDGWVVVTPGRYAVLAQFAADSDYSRDGNDSVPLIPYFIAGTERGVAAHTARAAAPVSAARAIARANARLHAQFREIERDEAPAARAYAARRILAPMPTVAARILAAADTVRTFTVRQSLNRRDPRPTTITARLGYAGSNVLVYVDNASAGVALGGFSSADYAALGRLFDDELFGLATRTFGAPGDTDRNGRTFVLFSPAVNRLTSGEPCGTFVAGFFDPRDLSGDVTANRGEIFYAASPGSVTGPGCRPLSETLVRELAPATFIHELQHLISYNEHVLQRRGGAEATWLNEGLSHYAEELGGRVYEARYPCPAGPPCAAGRSNPNQLFPDSAQGFLVPNFSNAYSYLADPSDFSLASHAGLSALEERGAAWLFVRWLADQKGESVIGRLVQTQLTGGRNVEAAAAEPFRALFADWLTAALLDDYPGATPGSIPDRLQFPSRNLRTTFARLNAVNTLDFPRPYPLAIADLEPSRALGVGGNALTWSMVPGTFTMFVYQSDGANGLVRFGQPEGGRFSAALRGQVTLVRLP
jgi:hypothetical protein